MAAIVYGGSPRHHSRMTNTTHNIHHQNALQQTHHYITSSNPSSSSDPPTSSFSPYNTHHHHHHHNHQNSNMILMPPAPYLMDSTLSVIHQQHQELHQTQSSQQQQQQFQSQSQSTPSSQSHYQHISLIYSNQRHHTKRKSAVELLAESKPFYVKSETVLDRHQQLTFRNSNVNGSNSANMCILSPSRTHSGIIHRQTNRRSASSSSDLLQTKLRKLLNADAKDCAIPEIPRYKPDNQKYDTFNKYQTIKYNQELSVHSYDDQNEVSVMFPSAFLSPQSLPPHPASDNDIYSYECEEPLILTENYRPISPPAEYATRCNYQRSYSQFHEANSDDPNYSSSYNINSHKSLPDLHAQISRHSPHSEVLSCCSRGNRSNKSGGGSSINRDSGGSSGHYTHRSEPCCKQKLEVANNKMCNSSSDFRRDSGSSTQHSGNSYYYSNSRYDCSECRAKYQKESECLLNFTTPEVPEAFQDDYSEKQIRFYEESKPIQKSYNHNNKQIHHHRHHNEQQKNSPTKTVYEDIVKDKPDVSPPLGTFKRQKCLRFKQRNRYSTSNDRPILRSKSDISDRYWNRSLSMIESSGKAAGNGLDKRGKSESLSQLEKFFDRLGLNDEKYEEIYNCKRRYSSDNDSDQSSTVFFSDVSTVDSTRLPDSTDTNQNSQGYRTTEPPSIVERNARIIKWLCNCRKLQLT